MSITSTFPEFSISGRKVGITHRPLIIAEIGINHEGNIEKAIEMVYDAHKAGCECVKFQCHIVKDEMIPNDVIPGNSHETIWDIISRCVLSEEDEKMLKSLTESLGMIYLSTPFSRAAADRLRKMDLAAYKIGSGECNNYPLVKHIASFGKPIILSTGMNDLHSIKISVDIIRAARVPYALMHCTSIYPTPYDKVRLGALQILGDTFPDCVLGLSDHSLGIWTCLGAIPMGARILEKHFTSDKSWPGPDVPISITPTDLKGLIDGSLAIYKALGGDKNILKEELPTINFAYACVVTTKSIKAGQTLNVDNIWIKRPGTGEIKAVDYERVLGKKAAKDLQKDCQISWKDLK